MIVIRDNIHYAFTKVDKQVFTYLGMSDGAKVLYGYLSGLPTGRNFSDSYMVKALGVTDRTLRNRKAELKDAGLILVHKIGPRSHMLFVGNLDKPAELVKDEWERSNDY